jgi:hypothetical protein
LSKIPFANAHLPPPLSPPLPPFRGRDSRRRRRKRKRKRKILPSSLSDLEK